jgi:hypothetical protein
LFYFGKAAGVVLVVIATHNDGPAKRPTHAPGAREAKEYTETREKSKRRLRR